MGNLKRETQMKIVLFVISLFLLLYLWFELDFNMRSASLMEVRADRTELESLKTERQEREKDLQLDLYFNEQKLIFDELSNTYFYPVVGEGNQAFNPRIKAQAHNDSGYRIIIAGEEINAETIRQNHTHTVFVYGDDWFQEFDLVVTTLPVLSIHLDDPIVNQEVGDQNKDVTISLFDTDPTATPTQQHIVSKAQIRHRGATSRIHPQKQFRLSLKVMSLGRNIRNNHLSLLGMREDDDWILYAPYSDAEKARNTLSNNLWFDTMADNNRFDIKNGIEGKYVELFINDRYWGIYTLMHPLDEKQLGLEEAEEPRESDYYYRMISNLPVEYPLYDGSLETNVLSPVELRFPEKAQDHQAKWEPFVTHYQMMNDDTNGPAYMEEHTDIENLIDYWLFFTLTQAHDNDTKNRNYIAKHDGDKYVVLESPWDLDLTWGNNWSDTEELRTIFLDMPNAIPPLYPSFITRNVQQGNQIIMDKIIDRYKELRSGGWSDEKMMERLVEMEADIYGSGAIYRNHIRWPRAAFSDSMGSFQDYVMHRLQRMDRYILEELRGLPE